MSYYTSLGGGSRAAKSSGRGGTATANRQLAAATSAAAKVEQARLLADVLGAIHDLHRATFPPAQRPIAPPPPPIAVNAVVAQHRNQAKQSTSVFARAERKAAISAAEAAAHEEVRRREAAFAAEHAAWQQRLDQEWDLLRQGDEDATLATLAQAFDDNEAAAAAVGVAAGEVTLVVVVPSPGLIPERKPTTTPAGNLSLKKLTKREVADWYKLLVCGHMLATVKEAFAVAPALTSARIVALRAKPADAYGQVSPEVIAATKFLREKLSGIRWEHADAAQVFNDAGQEKIFVQRGPSQELTPVDLANEPDLAAVVAAVEFAELV